MTPNPETSARTPASPDHATSAAEGRGTPDAVVVRIPGPLRALADGAGEVEVRGATVAGVLEALVDAYPGLRRHLLAEDGGVRDYVNVFVNDDDVRTLEGVATPVGPADTVTIVPSIAGG